MVHVARQRHVGFLAGLDADTPDSINLERSAGGHRAHDVLTISLVLRARVTSRIEGSGRALPFA